MQSLNTSDYRGHSWAGASIDEEDSYPLCVYVAVNLTGYNVLIFFFFFE